MLKNVSVRYIQYFFYHISNQYRYNVDQLYQIKILCTFSKIPVLLKDEALRQASPRSLSRSVPPKLETPLERRDTVVLSSVDRRSLRFFLALNKWGKHLSLASSAHASTNCRQCIMRGRPKDGTGTYLALVLVTCWI